MIVLPFCVSCREQCNKMKLDYSKEEFSNKIKQICQNLHL